MLGIRFSPCTRFLIFGAITSPVKCGNGGSIIDSLTRRSLSVSQIAV